MHQLRIGHDYQVYSNRSGQWTRMTLKETSKPVGGLTRWRFELRDQICIVEDLQYVKPCCGFCDTPSQVALPCRLCGRTPFTPKPKTHDVRLAAWEYVLRREQVAPIKPKASDVRLAAWEYFLRREQNHDVILLIEDTRKIVSRVEAWLKVYSVPGVDVWPTDQPLTWAMLRDEDWAKASPKGRASRSTEAWWTRCKIQQAGSR